MIDGCGPFLPLWPVCWLEQSSIYLLAAMPVFVAGLIVIGGWALAILASSVLAAALSRATGRLERDFELVIRYSVVTLAVILALAQLGVNVTVVTVLVATVVALGNQ